MLISHTGIARGWGGRATLTGGVSCPNDIQSNPSFISARVDPPHPQHCFAKLTTAASITMPPPPPLLARTPTSAAWILFCSVLGARSEVERGHAKCWHPRRARSKSEEVPSAVPDRELPRLTAEATASTDDTSNSCRNPPSVTDCGPNPRSKSFWATLDLDNFAGGDFQGAASRRLCSLCHGALLDNPCFPLSPFILQPALAHARASAGEGGRAQGGATPSSTKDKMGPSHAARCASEVSFGISRAALTARADPAWELARQAVAVGTRERRAVPAFAAVRSAGVAPAACRVQVRRG